MLSKARNLTSLSLRTPDDGEWNVDALIRLPPKLRTLAIVGPSVYCSSAFVQSVRQKLSAQTDRLLAFTLLDPIAPKQRVVRYNRGAYDDLIGSMVVLRWLEIGPCAVSNLATSLGSLTGLERLCVDQKRTVPSVSIPHTEMHALITTSSSLREVAVSRSIWDKWSAADQAAIEGAAKLKSIRLIQI